MPQDLISQFDRKYALPIETYRQVQNITQRNAIPAPIRWEGMMCYVISEGLSYVLTAGMENSDWVEFGALVDVTVVDNLLSTSPTDALSANQGRVLQTTKLSDAPSDGNTYGRLDGAWAIVGGGAVDSVFGRTGAVTAEVGDYASFYQVLTEKGAANGYTPLDSGAKVPIAYLPDSVIGQVQYQGTWAASTNTPTLANPPSAATKGHYYVASDNGTQFGISFQTGDWIISNGTAWEKVDNTDAVTSVFGRIGAVVANAGDYTFAQIGSKPTTLSGYGITDAVPTSRTLTAGTGLTGGGSLAADRTFAVDGTVVRTSGTQSIMGLKTFTADGIRFNDNNELQFGTGNDMQLYHDGTGNYLDLTFGHFRIRDGSTNRFIFERTTGNLTATGNITATNFILSSDRRLKKDIKDYTPAHIPIRWREFTWKESGERQIGTIAQETPKQFVTKGSDGKLAVKTVEMLMAKVAELEARIINLER